ncbi:MAG TPA: NADH-quinone oxidoreductase subunit C [Candidatus Omnitrophota bacterium]|nr:NADH-quinone oxidoreductase subunit C [Candidatus Omnitrophota bacterium]HQB11604.1 NADH-quinone oxidoreductase subunit C [Candidatus Omnitrophota bacterium]
MKTVIDGLKEKFGDKIHKVWDGCGKQVHVSVDRVFLLEIVAFLVRDHELRFLFLAGSDTRRETGAFTIDYVFSRSSQDKFLILQTRIEEKEPRFPSLTHFLPQANWQEREVQDLLGLEPIGHPDPRRLVLHEDWPQGVFPLRKDFECSSKIPRVAGDYVFDRVEGEGIFEIPVGPVHAGIIEPGHFRFSVMGESVIKLEIRHFYTHKGTEKSGEGKSPEHLICLAERISGDNSVAHAVACAQALEVLGGMEVPLRAQMIRVIYLELERLHNHMSDIAGISLDAAFSFGASQLMRLKESLLNLNERLTGTRLLRSAVILGGVCRDISEAEKGWLIETIKKSEEDFDEIVKILGQVDSLIDRAETTGQIKKEIAETLGAVGPVARASGVDRDLRRDHPYAAYRDFSFKVPVFTGGDVESRMNVKIQEAYESFKMICDALASMPPGPVRGALKPLARSRAAIGYVESPRGECFHWILTDKHGMISRWKVQSPSFSNWPLIEYAVLENIVPDFPLINKSMNLSYSGNDR